MVNPYAESYRSDRDTCTPSLSPSSVDAQANNRPGVKEDYQYYDSRPSAVAHNYEEFGASPAVIVHGGFEKNDADLPQLPPDIYFCFPPPPSAAYHFDSHLRLPHLHPDIHSEVQPARPSADAASTDKIECAIDSDTDSDQTLQHNFIGNAKDGLEMSIREAQGLGLEAALVEGEHQSTPECLAAVKIEVIELEESYESPPPCFQTSLLNQDSLVQEVAGDLSPEFHGNPKEPSTIRDPNVDSGSVHSDGYFMTDHHDNGTGQPEYCNICNKTHIPIGGPVVNGIWTLPEWIPNNVSSRSAQDAFTGVMSRLVALEEAQKAGYRPHKVEYPVWDLHFHEKNKHWTTRHARDWGGWWKCRDDLDAPQAERSCTHCHRFRRQQERPPRYSRHYPPPIEIQKEYLQDYIDHHSKMQGERDKHAALAMLRSEGIPQVLSRSMTYDEQQSMLQPRARLETSATDRSLKQSLLAADENHTNVYSDLNGSQTSPKGSPINDRDFP